MQDTITKELYLLFITSSRIGELKYNAAQFWTKDWAAFYIKNDSFWQLNPWFWYLNGSIISLYLEVVLISKRGARDELYTLVQ